MLMTPLEVLTGPLLRGQVTFSRIDISFFGVPECKTRHRGAKFDRLLPKSSELRAHLTE